MVSDAYATVEQYRALTGKTDTSADAQIAIDLIAISRYLDGKLGRFFTQESTSRIYRPDVSSDALITDDIVSVSELAFETSSGTYGYATTNYDLLPYNAPLGPEPRPYTMIRLTAGTFPQKAKVRVTGVFGWPNVPDAIQRATIHLAAILRIESPRATRRISELGDAIETSDDAMSIVRQLTDRYRRVSYV